MIRRRLAAIAALALGLVVLGLLIVLATTDARRGVLTVAVLALSLAAAWQGLVHRGAARVLGLGSGALLAVATVALLFDLGVDPEDVVGHGPRRRSRSTRAPRCPPASTARRSSSCRRSGSAAGRPPALPDRPPPSRRLAVDPRAGRAWAAIRVLAAIATGHEDVEGA